MLSRLRRDLPLWRRALRRRRRALTLLACALVVVALLPAVLPTSVTGAPVLVARQDLPVGTVLTPEHLRTVHLAEGLLPGSVPTEADALLGRRVARPLPEGTPLLPAVLDDPGAAPIPDGAVLMAVPVPQVLLAHLAPGVAIELLPTAPPPSAPPATGGADPFAEPAGSTPAAIPARVMSVPEHGSAPGGLGAPAAPGVEVLVAVDAGRSADLARALVSGGVVVAVVGYSPSGHASAASPPSA